MLKRFFEIKGFIDDEDPYLACNLPSGSTLIYKHSPAFETGIVKVIDDEVDQLSDEERNAMSCFHQINPSNGNASEDGLSLVQRALKNKRRKVISGEYSCLTFVPPTSNAVERLFSNARLVLTDYRKSMTPYTFECVMFLKFNREYWDLDLVAKIVGK